MTTAAKPNLPPAQFQLMQQSLKPTQQFAQWLSGVDTLFAAFGTPNLKTLVDAADDAAAATKGVAVGQAYRNGSILMVRIG